MADGGRRVIKKVDGGHGHHGGAWKVAYADFVTAMMALFMVLWLLASTDDAARKEISKYFRTGVMPDGEMAMKAAQFAPSLFGEEEGTPAPDDVKLALDERAETAKSMSKKLGELAKQDAELANVMKSVRIEIQPDGVLIEAVDQDGGLLFDSASAELKHPLEHFLEALAPILAKDGRRIEIHGHTDARPFAAGSRMTNWELSYHRAAASRDILTKAGVQEGNIDGGHARGSAHLFMPDNPLAAQNRRLSVKLLIAKPADTAAEPPSK